MSRGWRSCVVSFNTLCIYFGRGGSEIFGGLLGAGVSTW